LPARGCLKIVAGVPRSCCAWSPRRGAGAGVKTIFGGYSSILRRSLVDRRDPALGWIGRPGSLIEAGRSS